ncbi:MAG TPA: GspH/FimT family pseudopilin [Tepidisphaeraceae bacterium]|jgi:prepilin-type N-terminal cleavage/methylation domain-containing protein|nr:GspH/FimT family pseudopilin [Tepidisphaeraceae bacterium]
MNLVSRNNSSKTRARGRSGFTLLELVLVMILICTALAISAPDLRGFSANSKMKNVAQQVLALTNYARAEAAGEGRTYRVNFDQTGYYVSAEDDSGQFQQLQNEMGQTFQLPDGIQAQLTRSDGQPGEYIEFHADGRADAGQVKISHEDSQLYVVCESPAERFHVVSTLAGVAQ